MRFVVGTLGWDFDGIRILYARGRTSGTWRGTPVSPVETGGRRYLVSLRGESAWARDLRADPVARLQLGRRIEDVHTVEIAVEDRVPALREYLRTATRQSTRDLLADGARTATEEQLLAVAATLPVFALEER